jgi:general L-amino acid transport system permease protein
MQSPMRSRQSIPFWRDERFLQAAGQAVFVLVVFGFGYLLFRNMIQGLQSQGIALGFSFINQLSGFDIGESLIEYSRNSSYLRAFQVGMLNTLLVSLLGIIFSTIFGVVLGVASLSGNFLVNRLSRAYIEIIRNIPLLVLLIFWYTGFFLKLPRVKDAIVLPGSIYLSNRGVGIPWGVPTETFSQYLWVLAAALLAAFSLGIFLTRRGRQTGRMPLVSLWSTLLFLGIALTGWLLLPGAPLVAEFPYVKGLNLDGGLILSPEFMAILSGLVLYTAVFISEVVRAGIQSVAKGQVEASRALGLSAFSTLRLVVFPQALRVMVPPLTSQYLNLTKNSSLAVAIGFPDLFYVSNTIINQSGRAVEMISLVMLSYLVISLVTSFFMNWYNQHVRLVER